ncbi:DEKNAAC103133 [Brettanomyces naardenensis]|uniref:Ribosome quality control complex subunit 2 n=1 Tax=Brettanomyces naardenensis TaxID=13370 RepID=A0A448YMM9_BRENA|nr:DEKNAAC103133 [Brettanomyces naardenensis]
MKQRITSLDLKLLVAELRPMLIGYRLSNIYNLASNPRSFLLKFALPDSKVNLAIESGFKLYATEYQRPTLPQPSNFCTKLRKHLKSKRLTDISQVGDDRVVVLQFSDGMYYLVLEFFSAGNVLLLDNERKLLSLFRTVPNHHQETSSGEDFTYSVGQVYPGFDGSLFEKSVESNDAHTYTVDELIGWVKESQSRMAADQKKTKKKVLSINKLCFVNAPYLSSDLIQISLLENGVVSSQSCLNLLDDEELAGKVVTALQASENRLKALLDTPAGEVEGFILTVINPLFDESKDESEDNLKYTYEAFHPFEPIHKTSDTDTKIENVKGYSKTLDKFFTKIELSKASLGRQQQEAAAKKRLQLVRNENEKKLAQLTNIQESNREKGYLITLHSTEIEDCRSSVQELIDKQMDWKNIEKLIQVEQRRGNPTAKMIKSLNLLKNEITVTLPVEDIDDEDESDEETTEENEDGKPHEFVNVVIDITQSAFANSTRYFDAKKSAQEKQVKTEKNAALAIKNSENKIAQDLKKLSLQTKHTIEIKKLRTKYWFEKFYWFISNDGYLCIAGKDAIQIDSIYYRYLDNETDFLVSNNLDNALKVVVKNPYKNKEVPPSTLYQAGVYSLTTTKAWESKMSTSPWFVKGKGVSKKDFDGSILPPGLLNVSKEKTYLPPSPMVMGLGLLWVPDDETRKKYKESKLARDDEFGLEYADAKEGKKVKAEELATMLKKLREGREKGEEEEGEGEEQADETEGDDAQIETADADAPSPSSQTQVRIRGKKGKMKKIKEKYGDQDEEERRLRMSVLGTLKQAEQHTEKQNTDAQTSKVEDAASKKEKKILQQTHQLEKILQEVEEVQTDENEPYYAELFKLVNAPHKTDGIEECIVVFMPWGALSKYTYKVKVQPGTVKKGKTLSGAIDFFKKQTKALQKQGSEWYDANGIVDTINEADYLMGLTGSRYKLSTPGTEARGSKKGRGKGRR